MAPARRRWSAILELGGYVLVAVVLLGLLIPRVRAVDGFYLDEWLYANAAQEMWDRLPLGPFATIPEWTRGPQRLYAAVLALAWGPLAPPAAFTVSHVGNAALMVSAVVPAALLARRVVSHPLLRVLAVALAVAVPWLVFTATLLTENLAAPLFLWAVLAIVVAAERPGYRFQILALASLLALTLCRLNLAAMFVVLVVAVLVTDLRLRGATPWARWAPGVARRRAPIVAAAAVGVLAVAWVLMGGGGALGGYSPAADPQILDAIWGGRADDTARALLTYLQALVTGGFVLPFVLGVGTAVAGARGALGPAVRLPALVTLGSLVAVLATISIYRGANGGGEERYAFLVYAPVAILAVAGLERVRRMLPELALGGVVAAAALAGGDPFPGGDSDDFFAAPAGGFWTRVVSHRLAGVEESVAPWFPGAGEGWLLVAGGLVALVLFVWIVRRAGTVLTLGLAVALVAQLTVLVYDFDKLLYGTFETPGGLALSPDRERDRDDWIDQALPDGATAAMVPALITPAEPYGAVEEQEMWNRALTGVVALPYVGAPRNGGPGSTLVTSSIERGLATWGGPGFDWLVSQRDDPRVQWRAAPRAASAFSPYVLSRVRTPARAVWTTRGLDADGIKVDGRLVWMTLDRRRVPEVRSVTVTVQAPRGAPGVVTSWRVTRGVRRVARGEGVGGVPTQIRLPVPGCPTDAACPPVTWQLTSRGEPPTLIPIPAGPAEQNRLASLEFLSVRLQR